MPHLNTSSYGQYVPSCDYAAYCNCYYLNNHPYSPLITFRIRFFSTIWHPHSGQSIASYISFSLGLPFNAALIPPLTILSLTTYSAFGYTRFPHTLQVILLIFLVSSGMKVPRFLHCLSLLIIFTFFVKFQFNRLIRFFRTPCRGCFNRNFMRPRFSKTQKSFHFLNPMMRKVICDIFRVWMFAPKTRSAIFGPPPILAKFAFTALYISFLHSDTSIKSSLYLAF